MMITYRNALPEDISNIMKIELSSFNAVITETEETFLERITVFPEGFRIAQINGRTAGYISSEIWYKTGMPETKNFKLGHSIKDTHKPDGNELYISSMGLLPEMRGSGLGKKFFTAFLEYSKLNFRNIKTVILVVSENWHPARKIYTANGFREIATLKDFFSYGNGAGKPENGIVMRREL